MHLKKTYSDFTKAHNLAMLNLISKPKTPSCSLSCEEYKHLQVILIF